MTVTSREAPDGLELVRSFVNSLDIESGTDELATPASARSWLQANGLATAKRPTSLEVGRLREAREALRELLLANNGVAPPSAEAVRLLEDAAARARLGLRLEGGDGRLVPAAQGVDGALGVLLATVYDAMTRGTWRRLKACGNDRCRWAFYDHSRNRSGHWCSMAVCGNRHKVQEYRRRHAHPLG
jgi:predicted RNA-binding Zn ribbon-like protein